jgi:transcriptional regulator with XRE-family HTH domain
MHYCGKKVKEQRLIAGLSREELAVKAGLHSRTIFRAENNRDVHVSSFRKIATALEIPIANFIVKEEQPA